MAEIEINVMTRQYLSRRIDDIEKLRTELNAWESNRNNTGNKILWHFRIGDDREKLISLYPTIAPAVL